mgnify:CR=1 FL=1
MRKLLIKAAFISVLSSMFCLTAGAIPYRGYTYDGYDEVVPSQNGYKPVAIYAGIDFGDEVGALSAPKDIFVDKVGNIYILDSGNNRLLVLNQDYKISKILTTFNFNGELLTLNNPQGIFVDSSGLIYIADTGNFRALVVNRDGEIKLILEKPQTKLIDADLEFKPQKILADSAGNIYVAVAGIYQGALFFKPDGEFERFYGANTVEPSAALMLDLFWKRLLTDSQVKNISRYVPEEISSMNIDDRDFIYTVTKSLNIKQNLKKLNPSGKNILKKQKTYGELEIIYVASVSSASRFIDVCVDNEGNISTLDAQHNRIFQYDREGRLLFVFGGSGIQVGTFQEPSAITCQGDNILVLDSTKHNLTVFSPTDFGREVRTAVEYYNNGQYDESVDLWRNILKSDHNYTVGYISIGKSLMANKNYAEAEKNFLLGNDREGNSEAFAALRKQVVQKYFPLFALTSFLIIALIVWICIRKKRPAREASVRAKMNPFIFLIHPIDSAEEMKQKNSGSLLYAGIILSVWVVASVIEYSLTGFRFNSNNPDQINVILVFLRTLPIFLAWVCANWGVTTLLDGKGNMKDIFISNAYCLIPFTIATLISVLLSYVLTLPEGIFIHVIILVGTGWSILMLLGVLSGIHDYSVTQTLTSTFFTVIGVLVIVFLVLLASTLLQQAFLFVYSIASELIYRL